MASEASKAQATSPKQPAKQRSAAPLQKTAAPADLAGHLQQAVTDPGSARPADILTLQRSYGNQAVQHLLAGATVQAKLTVGPAGDHYEQEADRVADQVMLMATPQSSAPPPAVQR